MITYCDENLLKSHVSDRVTLNSESLLLAVNNGENLIKVLNHVISKLVDDLACFINLGRDRFKNMVKSSSTIYRRDLWNLKLFYNELLVTGARCSSTAVALVCGFEMVKKFLI